MRKVEKQKRITKGGLAIALTVAFVLTLTAAIVLYFTVFSNKDDTTEKVPPTPLAGEGVANGSLMAYPLMEESKINKIAISLKNDKGEDVIYGMERSPEKDGSFVITYVDEDGKEHTYEPKISELDEDFNYSDIYSIEMGDGFGGVTKLKYLCMALMYPYVEERIELTPEEKEVQLDVYGLAEGEYETIVFEYTDENGNSAYHEIQIGDKTTLGTGYYIRVDRRECVYASYQNQLEYAFGGFLSFIKPLVIAPGEKIESAYLTDCYEQWENKKHTEGEVTDDSRVIVFAEEIIPIGAGADKVLPQGYIYGSGEKIEFDLSEYKKLSEYQGILKSLPGKTVGDYSQNKIIFTNVIENRPSVFNGQDKKLKEKEIDFTKDTFKYEYSITEIEAILSDSREISEKGVTVGDNNLVKLAYTLKIDGVNAAVNVLHAVVDLSDTALPASFVDAIRASAVGTLPSPINLSLDYTKNNSLQLNVKYVITELVAVYDKKGNPLDKVTDESTIIYKYRLKINGVYEDVEHISYPLNLATDTGEESAKIKAALKGTAPSQEKIELEIYEYTEYYEYFKDFVSYSVSKIEYFVTKDLIVSFMFKNKSEIDPFYGESIYENTMPEDNKYSMYGLNNGVCQKIVNILTGINEAASSPPTGLIGTKTVAVGINNPDVMEEFGLYAYTVKFSLPRDFYEIENADPDKINDYHWYETLNFTLYISEEEEGKRYVASDLYDIVVEMDAANFVFLKYDFVNFFARRTMMQTAIEHIEGATFELYYEDLKGVYQMTLDKNTVYWSTAGERYGVKENVPEGVTAEPFDEIRVNVKPFGECTPNKLTQYIDERTTTGMVSLTELYNRLTGDGNYNVYSGYDPLGTSNFKKLLENIYLTGYSGVISPEEQDDILKTGKMVFRMSYKLDSETQRYVYEFYRYSESRVMVRLYLADYNAATNEYSNVRNSVSDFHISNFALRKIVNNFKALMNLEMIDKELGYPED